MAWATAAASVDRDIPTVSISTPKRKSLSVAAAFGALVMR
jgi:hypothetical protein